MESFFIKVACSRLFTIKEFHCRSFSMNFTTIFQNSYYVKQLILNRLEPNRKAFSQEQEKSKIKVLLQITPVIDWMGYPKKSYGISVFYGLICIPNLYPLKTPETKDFTMFSGGMKWEPKPEMDQ